MTCAGVRVYPHSGDVSRFLNRFRDRGLDACSPSKEKTRYSGVFSQRGIECASELFIRREDPIGSSMKIGATGRT
jgi:hypothetical protein